MANRLADAISPYLRSHAENPVDWWPWGAEAFAEAKRRDVPVLISIGYSTCHWCHVMARESFSDPTLAQYINSHFVAIKVDREEHPDVDASYMAAVSAFTQNLGWPLNVFATPGGSAFFAGTYFPPEPVNGMPAFGQALGAVVEAWQERREGVDETARAVSEALAASVHSLAKRAPHDAAEAQQAVPTENELHAAVQALAALEDPIFGGFGVPPSFEEPKFAVAPVLGFLAGQAGDGAELAARALKLMGASPLRDPVEGGFFRYSTRRDWGDPHYERMLYDNALLLDVAVRVWQNDSAANSWAATLSEALARFLLSVLRLPSGAFASGQDSESMLDGQRNEGGYYALDAENRALQPAPALDDKVLAGWNGLAIAALARAGAAFQRPDWIEAAQSAADHVVSVHLKAETRTDASEPRISLARASLGHRVSPARATLEDYGMLAGGLLAVAIASGEARHAITARSVVDATLRSAARLNDAVRVVSAEAGADSVAPVFAVPGGADPVLTEHGLVLEVDISEGAYPSGLSAIAQASYELWLLTGEQRYRSAAESVVALVGSAAVERPLAYGATLRLAARLRGRAVQLVSVVTTGVAAAGDDGDNTSADGTGADGTSAVEQADELLRVGRQNAASVDLAAVVSEAQADDFAEAGFGLFAGRHAQGGAATSYLCENMVCLLPVTTGAALAVAFGEQPDVSSGAEPSQRGG